MEKHPNGLKAEPASPAAEAAGEVDFKVWTAEDVRQWRARQPRQLSAMRVLAWQAAAAVVAVAVAAGVGASVAWVLSLAYGALAVLLPAALMVYRIVRPAGTPAAAVMRMMVWELVKIGLTVGLLLLAPRLVPDLSWVAVLIGLMVALKAHWLAVALTGRAHGANSMAF